MQSIYLQAKTLHILGFITAIGVTFSTFLAYKQFWKLYHISPDLSFATFKTFQNLQIAGMLGLLVVLLAGISMLILADYSFTRLVWFQIKLGFVVLIFVNGFTLGRASTLQLNALMEKRANKGDSVEAGKLELRVNTFQAIQLSLYAIIILLSVFRIS